MISLTETNNGAVQSKIGLYVMSALGAGWSCPALLSNKKYASSYSLSIPRLSQGITGGPEIDKRRVRPLAEAPYQT